MKKNEIGCICGSWSTDEPHTDYCEKVRAERKVQFVSCDGTLGDPLPPQIAELTGSFTIENYPKRSDFRVKKDSGELFYTGDVKTDPLVNYLQRCIDGKCPAIVDGQKFNVHVTIDGEAVRTFRLKSDIPRTPEWKTIFPHQLQGTSAQIGTASGRLSADKPNIGGTWKGNPDDNLDPAKLFREVLPAHDPRALLLNQVVDKNEPIMFNGMPVYVTRSRTDIDLKVTEFEFYRAPECVRKLAKKNQLLASYGGEIKMPIAVDLVAKPSLDGDIWQLLKEKKDLITGQIAKLMSRSTREVIPEVETYTTREQIDEYMRGRWDEKKELFFRAHDLNVQALDDDLEVEMAEDDPLCDRLKKAYMDNMPITVELATWLQPRQYQVTAASTGPIPDDGRPIYTEFDLRGLGSPAQAIDEISGLKEITRGTCDWDGSEAPLFLVEAASPLAAELAACMAQGRPVISGDVVHKVTNIHLNQNGELWIQLKEV